MKIIKTLSGLLVLAIVTFFFFTQCQTDYNKAFSTKIKQLSRDEDISENDYELLSKFLNEHINDDDLFADYLSNDTLLDVRLSKDAKQGSEIFFPTHVPPIVMGDVRFYIETSMSMGGYMNLGTDFQDVGNILISLFRNIGSKDNINYVHFYPNTIAANIQKYENIDSYASDLTNSRFTISGSSPLNEIFKIITNSSKVNDINIFMTDGIMSGTDDEIRDDPNFNLRQREFMAAQINAIFSKQKEKDWGMSIYAFRSVFNPSISRNWVYFTFNNTKVTNPLSDRPFYVFVFGHRDLLEEINDKIEGFDRLDKRIQEKSYLGLDMSNASNFVLFNSCFTESRENTLISRNGLEVLCNNSPSQSNPVEFAIGLNLKNTPQHIQSIDYLRNHLKLEDNNGVEANIEIFDFPGDIQNELSEHRELPKVLSFGCTHYIKVQVNSLYIKETILTFKILKENSKWHENWSTDNDSDIGTNPNTQKKTFNFKYLVQGIQDAYTSKGDFISEINVKLINN